MSPTTPESLVFVAVLVVGAVAIGTFAARVFLAASRGRTSTRPDEEATTPTTH
jgi:hypothetical protein